LRAPAIAVVALLAAFCRSIGFCTDVDPPVVASVEPDSLSVITTDLVRVRADVSDSGSGVDSVWFIMRRFYYEDTTEDVSVYDTLARFAAPPYERVCDFTRFPDCDQWRMTLIVSASDRAGNRATGRKAAAGSGAPQSQGKPQSRLLADAKAHVQAHFTEESLTLSDTARSLGLNHQYFSRAFSREAGTPFITYVNSLRVEAAKTLLREGALNVSEVAFRVGFGSVNNFARVFKRMTGVTPKDYRARPEDMKKC